MRKPSLLLAKSEPRNLSYIKEARFSEIKYFDGAKYITRSVTLGGVKVSAEGVGI